LLLGAGLLLSAVIAGGTPDQAGGTSGKIYSGWALASIFVGALLAVCGVLLLVEWREAAKFRDPSRRALRLDRLTASLRQALSDIDRIRQEVDRGSALLKRLEEEAEVKAQLAQLRSEEAKAVLAQLTETLRREGTRITWYGVLTALVFFGLGALLTLLVHP
jgi:hypothetical protein